jgi:dihydrofolate reductase
MVRRARIMTSKTPWVLLAALADNGVIGRDNQLIWHLSSDLKRFKALTMGCPLVMGRKTFESIGQPLPGRESIVLTRDPHFAPAGVHVVHDLVQARDISAVFAEKMGSPHIAVIGGAEIYAQALPFAEKLYLTHVHAAPEGDAFFPAFDKNDFTVVAREEHTASDRNDHAFSFVDYQRKNRK